MSKVTCTEKEKDEFIRKLRSVLLLDFYEFTEKNIGKKELDEIIENVERRLEAHAVYFEGITQINREISGSSFCSTARVPNLAKEVKNIYERNRELETWIFDIYQKLTGAHSGEYPVKINTINLINSMIEKYVDYYNG